jgi:hypothetical protein
MPVMTGLQAAPCAAKAPTENTDNFVRSVWRQPVHNGSFQGGREPGAAEKCAHSNAHRRCA